MGSSVPRMGRRCRLIVQLVHTAIGRTKRCLLALERALRHRATSVPAALSTLVARPARREAPAQAAQQWRSCVQEAATARRSARARRNAALGPFARGTRLRQRPAQMATSVRCATLRPPCLALPPRSASLGKASHLHLCAPSARLERLGQRVSLVKSVRVMRASRARQITTALGRQCWSRAAALPEQQVRRGRPAFSNAP